MFWFVVELVVVPSVAEPLDPLLVLLPDVPEPEPDPVELPDELPDELPPDPDELPPEDWAIADVARPMDRSDMVRILVNIGLSSLCFQRRANLQEQSRFPFEGMRPT
jgi:hypothetical protein